MAKKKRAGDSTAKPPAKKTPKTETVEVVLRRPMKLGDVDAPTGTKIGEVRLEPGIGLNYLVDAVRNGIAGMKKE